MWNRCRPGWIIFPLAVFWLAAASPLSAQTGQWNYWGSVPVTDGNPPYGSSLMATDGTNLFVSVELDGVYEASFSDQWFAPLPMTGFPVWDPVNNTNGFSIDHLAVSSQGILVISGRPVRVTVTPTGSTIAPGSGLATNTQPVFYWFDAPNQVWHPAAIYNKTYPYTTLIGNFTTAADGALWTCSGFAPYAYRSTDGGQSYTAMDIDALVPTNYFPVPFSVSETSFGNLFGIVGGWNNEIVVGTETGGFLYTTNNGQSWSSLDANFTDTNSINPLGRIGNAQPVGLDHHGWFLLGNSEMVGFPAEASWLNVPLIGWRPADGSYYDSSHGLGTVSAPEFSVTTQTAGTTFAFENQNDLLQGGVFVTGDGANWSQFNVNTPLTQPFPNGETNIFIPGNCLTVAGNRVFMGVGENIYYYDSAPSPITNFPPVALPQNVNLFQHTSTNFTLTGSDPDGDLLNFTVTVAPTNGALTGTPPHLTYSAPHQFVGLDQLQFEVDDGMATSAPVAVNFAVAPAASQPPVITFTASGSQGWIVEPTNIALSAAVTAANGLQQVNFYADTALLAVVQNPPYNFIWTNPPPGDHVLNACAIDDQQAATWAQPTRVLVLPSAPLLQLSQPNSANVEVSWPITLDGFLVETSTNVLGPWALSPFPPFYFTNVQTATIPTTNGQQYFRLEYPR